MSKWIAWIELILGLWVLISPWILGFAGLGTALWNNVIMGVLLAIFALWSLFGTPSSSETITPPTS